MNQSLQKKLEYIIFSITCLTEKNTSNETITQLLPAEAIKYHQGLNMVMLKAEIVQHF